MKLIAFAILFMILLPAGILAAGLEFTQVQARVDYDDSYVYKLEDRYHRDRATYALVPLRNDSKVNVDVYPGSNLTFTIKAENTFRKKPTIYKVYLRTTIKRIDDGSDVYQESTDSNIAPGDEKISDLKFSIPVSVDSGTYNVLITADGEDLNRTPYLAELRLKLEVKKLSNDLKISNYSLNPSVVDCDRKASLTATIINAGSNLENDVALEFRSSSLSINSFDKGITLSASNDANDKEKQSTKTFNIDAPTFLKSGTYPISINLYWKGFVLFDRKNLQLTVRDCAKGSKSSINKGIESNLTSASSQGNQTADEGFVTTTIEVPPAESPLFWLFFLAVFFAIIILTSIAVVFFVVRKPQ